MSDKFLSGNVNLKPNGDRGWIMGEFENVKLPYPFFGSTFAIEDNLHITLRWPAERPSK